MSNYIEIQLINFRCWVNNTFRLHPGVNLISGDSGIGKSTICKAIHFAIFGGRKHTEIENWNHVGKGTQVILHFVSDQLQYKIIRTRPPEILTVYIFQNGEMVELKSDTAQDWICNQFGAEDKWIASSSISMKKPHFLLNASNSDKTSLLQQISLGDVSTRNQPDTYLTVIKSTISTYNGFVSKLDDEIRVQQSIRNNIAVKNPQMMSYGNITKDELISLIEFNNSEKLRLDQLRRDYTSISSRRVIQNKLDAIPKIPVLLEEVEKRIQILQKLKRFRFLNENLNGFTTDVLSIDYKDIEKNKYLYSKYKEAGWSTTTDISKFLKDELEKNKRYKEQVEIENRNNIITNSNNRTKEINNNLRRNYEKRLLEYNQYIKRTENFNIRNFQYIDLLSNLEKEQKQLINDDDLSQKFIIGLIDDINKIFHVQKLLEILSSFTTDVLTINEKELETNKYLYVKYINAGLNIDSSNNIDVSIFLESKKKEYEEYKEQLNIERLNREIEESNRRKNEINNNLMLTYQNKLTVYKKQIKDLENYDRENQRLQDILKECKVKEIKLTENDNLTISFIDTLLDNISNIRILRSLKETLLNFSDEVLTINKEDVINANNLYTKYINCGFSISSEEDISLFLIRMSKYYELYKEYINITSRNKEIEKQNNKNSLINFVLKQKYQDELLSYDKKLKLLQEYDTEEQRLSNVIIDANKKELIKLGVDDDLSVDYVKRLIYKISLSMNELICPNCNHGLNFENGKLCLGSINNGEVTKQLLREQLDLANLQLETRNLILNANNNYELFLKNNSRIVPELPIESEYLVIEQLIPLTDEILQILENLKNGESVRMEEPKLLTFDVPIFGYKKVNDLLDSYQLIPKYNEYIELNSKLMNSPEIAEIMKLENTDELYINANNQLIFRKETKRSYDTYNTFIRNNIRIIPEIPVKESYLTLDLLKEVNKEIKKPNLDLFDMPSIEYNRMEELLRSQSRIPVYYEYQKYKNNVKSFDFDVNQMIVKASEQLKIRKKIDEIKREYNTFLLDNKIEKYEEPIEDTYLAIEQIIPINETVVNSKLDTFDNPSIDYNRLIVLIKSYELIKLYYEYVELDVSLTIEDKNIKFDDSNIFELDKLKKNIIENNANIKCLTESLIGLVEDDPEIENKIKLLQDTILFNDGKIVAGYSIMEILNLNSILQEYETKRNEIVTYITTISELYTYIQELGTSCLQCKIDEVNVYLSSILDDLFKDPIEIELSSHRTLKNGDQKLQINFGVDYKGHKLKGTELFSEGEEERLSIALLMVFSRMNTSPILIIDEVLAGMNEELRVKCIEIIEKWSTGKFVIHICHSIIQGSHSNIIQLS